MLFALGNSVEYDCPPIQSQRTPRAEKSFMNAARCANVILDEQTRLLSVNFPECARPRAQKHPNIPWAQTSTKFWERLSLLRPGTGALRIRRAWRARSPRNSLPALSSNVWSRGCPQGGRSSVNSRHDSARNGRASFQRWKSATVLHWTNLKHSSAAIPSPHPDQARSCHSWIEPESRTQVERQVFEG
jgi:hypothetical protein